MMDHDTLRRAAVLIASLKPSQADELVAQLSTRDAKRLQACVANLSPEDLAASADVIEDFLDHHQEPVEIHSASSLVTQKPEQQLTVDSAFNIEPDFDFLDQVSPTLVADFLSSVHSQIGAAILSALPSKFAGVILSYFDSQKQQDVLERIAASGVCAAESLQFALLFCKIVYCRLTLMATDIVHGQTQKLKRFGPRHKVVFAIGRFLHWTHLEQS